MNAPTFIDVEASALVGGFPIEVGWATPIQNSEVNTASLLIDPAQTNWEIDRAWDPKAEALHGLTLAALKNEGMPARTAAARLVSAFGVRKAYSDNPEIDKAWIEQLFAEAGMQRTFIIPRKSAATMVDELASRARTGDLDFTAAEIEARRRAGTRHRAGPDAAYWAHLWSLIADGYRAPETARPDFGPLRHKP